MDNLPVAYSDMGGFPIDHSDQPIRLFKSNYLEFFTHVTPLTVVIIWLPVILWLLFRSLQDYDPVNSSAYIPLCILFGMVFWTFAEYTFLSARRLIENW